MSTPIAWAKQALTLKKTGIVVLLDLHCSLYERECACCEDKTGLLLPMGCYSQENE